MKRLLACISLILYAGYITGIPLISYTQQVPLTYLSEQNTAYDYSQQPAGLSGEDFFNNVSLQHALPIHSHTVVIGKIKLPCAFSCPIITAGFTSTRFQNIDKFSTAKFVSQPLPLTPIFLRNCVLRI